MGVFMYKALFCVVVNIVFLSSFSLSYSMDSDFPSGLPRGYPSERDASVVVVAQSRWPLGSFVFGRLCQNGAVPVFNLSTGIDRAALFFQRKIVGWDKNCENIIDPASGAGIVLKEWRRFRPFEMVKGMFRRLRRPRGSCPKGKVFGSYDSSDYERSDKRIKDIKRFESAVAGRNGLVGRGWLSFVKWRYSINQTDIDKVAELQDKGQSFSGYMEKGESFFGKHGFTRACAKKCVRVLGTAGDFVGKRLVKSYKLHECNRGLRMWGTNLSGYGERSILSAYYDERKQEKVDGALSCAGRFVLSYMRNKTL